MQRNPKRIKTIVGVLSDADPHFVSLVEQGANQRGFHSIKAHKEKAMTDRNTALKAAATNAVVLTRIDFDGDTFPDKDSVAAYLTSKGYTDFEVLQDDTGLHVLGEVDAQIEGALRQVQSPKDAGVTYTLGSRAKSAEEAPDDDASAAEGDEDKPSEEAGKADDEAADPAPEDEGTETDGAPGAQDPAPADDKPADDKAEGDDAPEGGKDGDNAAEDGGVRKRSRPGALRIDGASVTSYVGKAEELQDALEGRPAKKSIGDMVDAMTYSLPGLWVVQDALAEELSSLIMSRRATAESVSTALSDFTRAVNALFSAYETIINGAAVSKGAKVVGVSEDELEAVKARVIGAPNAAKSEDNPEDGASPMDTILASLNGLRESVDQVRAELAAHAEKTGQAAKTAASLFDLAFVEAIEEEAPGEAAEETPRSIPGRKSAQAPEVEAEEESPEREDAAEAVEAQRRAAKRLGME